jgi:parvulin-like peptidyl-prolyl isomerase
MMRPTARATRWAITLAATLWLSLGSAAPAQADQPISAAAVVVNRPAQAAGAANAKRHSMRCLFACEASSEVR